jgi:hypothetical protein
MVFFKTKPKSDGSIVRPPVRIEVAPYYYYTKKSCYLRKDADGQEIKPFLTFANDWKGINSNL